jgi:hypothetical protein
MSVRAVRELLVQGAFHITEWALLSFLFERFVWSLGSWSSIFSFFSSFPGFGRTGTSFGKHPIVGIE